MRYAYYPGCSLTGTARRLDKGVKRVFARLGHELVEIPDWNCCGAFEYGDRRDLIEFSEANLRRAESSNMAEGGVVAPCPACYKNLKEADQEKTHAIYHPLELFERRCDRIAPDRKRSKGSGFYTLLRLPADASRRDGHRG